MAARIARAVHAAAACASLEAAQQATDLEKRDQLLGHATNKLAAAQEPHLMARVNDVRCGRADIALLPTIVRGLKYEYNLA